MPLSPPLSLHEVAEACAKLYGPWRDSAEREAARSASEMEDNKVARFIFQARERLTQQAKEGNQT
jgi:hypothetical protein